MILDMDEINNVGQMQVIDDDQLVAALDHLGVEFVAGNEAALPDSGFSPSTLLSGLANSEEARVRLALIPLLLLHPEFSGDVHQAMTKVLPEKQHYLKCYYLASHLLQEKYRSQLESLFGKKALLPVLFEKIAQFIDAQDVDGRLRKLSEYQTCLSNRPINWYGTYEHAYSRLVTHKLWKIQWQ